MQEERLLVGKYLSEEAEGLFSLTLQKEYHFRCVEASHVHPDDGNPLEDVFFVFSPLFRKKRLG